MNRTPDDIEQAHPAAAPPGGQATYNSMVASRVYQPFSPTSAWPPIPPGLPPIGTPSAPRGFQPIMAPPPATASFGPRLPHGHPPDATLADMLRFQQQMMQDMQRMREQALEDKADALRRAMHHEQLQAAFAQQALELDCMQPDR